MLTLEQLLDGLRALPKPERRAAALLANEAFQRVLDLFAEQGFEGVCVEAVAARAGVGKATIYRRWPNKEELLLAALSSMKSPFPEPTGNVRDDLVAQLAVMCADRADPRKARRYALLLGEGQKYPRLMQRYKETVVGPRHDAIREAIRRGIAAGIHCGTSAYAARAIGMGFRLVTVGSDSALMLQAARAAVQGVRGGGVA